MPAKLVTYIAQLSLPKTDKQLWAVYRWTEGEDFTRYGYLLWLDDLIEWFARFSGSKLLKHF